MSKKRNRSYWQWLALVVIIALLAGCSAPAAPAAPAPEAPAQEAAPSTSQEAAAPSASKEAPMLAELVAAGSLPPVEERLPPVRCCWNRSAPTVAPCTWWLVMMG